MRKNELIDSFKNIYGKQIDIDQWLESKFNLIHSNIFKNKPFIIYRDGELIAYGKSV